MGRLRFVAMLVAIFLISLPPGGLTRAELRVPVLHYYNKDTGLSAVGIFGAGDKHRTLPPAGNFSPGWTHVIHMSNSWQNSYLDTDLFFYRADTGAGAIAWLNNASQYTTIASYPDGSFSPGWTHIISLGSDSSQGRDRLFFYNSATALGALALVSGDGNITTIKTYARSSGVSSRLNGLVLDRGWTSIVRVLGGIFFYDARTGNAELGTISSDGDYIILKTYSGLFSSGWTHIVYYFSENMLVYYNANSGSLAIGQLDRAGNHTTLKAYNYSRGWTIVVPMSGQILFYNGNNGAVDLGRIKGGTYTFRSFSAGSFSSGWTHINYGH